MNFSTFFLPKFFVSMKTESRAARVKPSVKQAPVETAAAAAPVAVAAAAPAVAAAVDDDDEDVDLFGLGIFYV